MTTPKRFIAGAIDLGEVKARAEAKAKMEQKTAAAKRLAAEGHSAYDPLAVVAAQTVTRDTIEDEVIGRSMQIPVVVLVGTDRAETSTKLKEDFTSLAQQANLSWVFAYIDADSSPELVQIFGIQAVPTVIAMAGGQPVTSFQGGQPVEALQQWTASLVKATVGKLEGLPEGAHMADSSKKSDVESQGDAPDWRIAEAEQLVSDAKYDEAIARFGEVLETEANNARAQGGLAQAKLLKRLQRLADTDQTQVIRAADENPKDPDKALAAADCQIAGGQTEAAFARLTHAMIGNSPENKDILKKRLIELFQLCDPADPRVADARRAMASALF